MADDRVGSYYGYVIVAAGFVVMAVIWGTSAIYGVFFESFIHEFGWTRALTSGSSSLQNVTFSSVCILGAGLADRFGPRPVITACGLLLGIGYLLMSLIHNAWQLYVYHGVIVACGMGAYITMLSLVAKWFERRRGMMTAIVFSGMGIGTMVAPPIASRLISIYAWRASYAIIGIVALILVVLAAQLLRRSPLESRQHFSTEKTSAENAPIPGVKGLSFPEAVRTKEFWLLTAPYFFFLYSLLTVMVHVVIHATDIGISAASAANILAIIGGSCVVGMNAAGNAADRIGNKRTLAISFLLMTIAFCWLLFAHEVWSAYLFAVMLGLAYGGIQVCFSPLVAELFGLRSHGVILGSAALGGGIGAALGPLVAGYIFDTTRSYDLAFITCAIMTAAGVIMASLLRPVIGKDQPT